MCARRTNEQISKRTVLSIIVLVANESKPMRYGRGFPWTWQTVGQFTWRLSGRVTKVLYGTHAKQFLLIHCVAEQLS